MKAANYDVKLLKDEFGAGAPDPQWLPVVAARGWIIIGKDDRWRYRAEEKQILINARARAFIFVSKSAKTTRSIPWRTRSPAMRLCKRQDSPQRCLFTRKVDVPSGSGARNRPSRSGLSWSRTD